MGFVPESVWCPVPSRTQRTEPYPVPKTVAISTRDTEEAACSFSPGPFSVVVLGQGRSCFVGVKADRGWHVWNTVEFAATRQGVEVRIDLEGHTSPEAAQEHTQVVLLGGTGDEPRMSLLSRGTARAYPIAFRRPPRSAATWWHRPIYCGWGDQVAASLMLEGPGPEARALAYCTQGLYTRWLDRLEAAGVPIGTVTVDAGWSPGGVWEPYPIPWPDMRGFIAEQHAQGRKVLLWVGAWLTEGLPDSWCVRVGSKRLVADPTHPEYRRFLRKQVRALLSPKGLDADGFKIDQLAYVPNERGPEGGEHFGRFVHAEGDHPRLRVHGEKWGCELLYQLQRDIYRAAKAAKPDAMITSSTAHAYFHNTLDVFRLHDTWPIGPDTDVLGVMKARADLSGAVLPNALVDADDWICRRYDKWLEYTLGSYRLGIPCTLYAERFVASFDSEPTTLEVPLADLERIGRRWRAVLP